MALFGVAKAQAISMSFNGEDGADFEMPIPMVSFGIKWSF
jgi:hypothetical protein